MEYIFLAGPPEPPRVHGNQHICLGELAFIDDTLDKRIAAAFDQVDLDARLAREFFVQGHIGVVVSGGVDVDDLLRDECRRPNAREGKGEHRR